LILATGNRHKLAEMEELLPTLDLRPLPAGFEMPPEVRTPGQRSLIFGSASRNALA